MATPNRFFKWFSNKQQKASLAHRVETHVEKHGVHKMTTSLGIVRVKLEYKLGKMWLLIRLLIDTYFCVFFLYLIIGGTFESFDLLIVPFTFLVVVLLILVG